MVAEFVGSPIAEDKATHMSDAQWVSAMQTYDGSTDRYRGGPVELSRMLCDFTRRDRMRFASLALSMSDNLDPMYFSAILGGLSGRGASLSKEEKEADRAKVAAIPIETFVDVINRLQ